MGDNSVKCPNCNQQDTTEDLDQDDFTEYRCWNENCTVEVFRSVTGLGGSDE